MRWLFIYQVLGFFAIGALAVLKAKDKDKIDFSHWQDFEKDDPDIKNLENDESLESRNLYSCGYCGASYYTVYGIGNSIMIGPSPYLRPGDVYSHSLHAHGNRRGATPPYVLDESKIQFRRKLENR
ncbi:hypothetical protein MCOR30_009541 [Pyricularia oryzae]|nr:hypothetical protein MCOR30_009541 [Pyricularia oryzae]